MTIRHNLCPNPRAGVDNTGWTGGITPTRVTGISGMPVTTAVRYGSNSFMQGPTGAASPGLTYTASFYLTNNTGFNTGTKTVYLGFTRSVGGTDFSATTTVNVTAGATVRVSHTAVAPANTTGVFLAMDAAGSPIDISACLIEQSGTLGTYFDGSFPNSSWDGTPENSPSTFDDTVSTTPVKSSLSVKWRVSNKVKSSVTLKWRVFNKVKSSLSAKWRVFGKVKSSLSAKWAVAGKVKSRLTLKWRVLGIVVPPPTLDEIALDVQRRMTAAFIANDPTTAALIPRTRQTTTAGGFTYVDQPVRLEQTFKLVELAFDQRPTVTIAGVERQIDYHLVGPWDMQIAVGDYWESDDGTRYEVVGFSEGWDYMVKAFVNRRVPRDVVP